MLVVAAVIAVASYQRHQAALKIASVQVSVPPKASQSAPSGVRPHTNISGDAPWALSALPECFVQIVKATSPTLPYVLARIPKDAPMVRPPMELHFDDCTLRVVGDRVFVKRGADSFRIPPASRIYFGGRHLALLRAAGGHYELRVYETVAGGGAMRI